jgi:hypothetical protein
MPLKEAIHDRVRRGSGASVILQMGDVPEVLGSHPQATEQTGTDAYAKIALTAKYT